MEEANIPIASMNSSTGIPLRTWTFLKTTSDICGFWSGPAWPAAATRPSRNTVIVTMAPRIVRLHPNFMSYSLWLCTKSHLLVSEHRRFAFADRQCLTAMCNKAIAEDIAHLCCVPDDWRLQISDLAACRSRLFVQSRCLEGKEGLCFPFPKELLFVTS